MTVRQVVLDTETTGLQAEEGDRIIEIGCVELIDRQVTGRIFHSYCNPERPLCPAALKIHRIDDQFHLRKPVRNGMKYADSGLPDFESQLAEIVKQLASLNLTIVKAQPGREQETHTRTDCSNRLSTNATIQGRSSNRVTGARHCVP